VGYLIGRHQGLVRNTGYLIESRQGLVRNLIERHRGLVCGKDTHTHGLVHNVSVSY